jgi:hypothetical protein
MPRTPTKPTACLAVGRAVRSRCRPGRRTDAVRGAGPTPDATADTVGGCIAQHQHRDRGESDPNLGKPVPREKQPCFYTAEDDVDRPVIGWDATVGNPKNGMRWSSVRTPGAAALKCWRRTDVVLV